MTALIDTVLNKRPAVMLIFVTLVLAGIYSYIIIPKESNPDINIPIIYVSMEHEGISPKDAEKLLVRPIEQELNAIEGVKEMTSAAYEGGANVVLEFNAGFDADKALDDVRVAVDKAKLELPEETDDPIVNEVNFSLFPALVVVLSGDISERSLLNLARKLKDRLETIPQVLEVNIAGGRDEQLEIIVDKNSIENYGLSGLKIINFFQRSNRLVASGSIEGAGGKFSVKIPGVFDDIDDIANMPIKTNNDSVVRVKDIAKIRFNYKDPTSFASLNGKKAIALEIVKKSGENVIETIKSVRKIVKEDSKFWPNSVSVDFVKDESERIKTRLSDLQNNIISAILLVMIICILSLGVQSSLLVGLAIPGAFLSGVLFLYIVGMSVNIVVLFALILSIGLLVDGAIVVTEYADRKISEGLSPTTAYSVAAKYMAWPIIASTATTLAAFLPLLFWPDVVGQFIKFLPITLIAVLTSSLVMALVFVPTIGSIIVKKPRKVKENRYSIISKIYEKILKLVLKFPASSLILAVVILLSVHIYYQTHGHGVKFFPDIEPDTVNVEIHARGNLSIFEQYNLVKKVENKISNIDGIKNLYTRVGNAGGSNLSLRSEDVVGVIQINFDDWEKRPPTSKIISQLKEKTKNIAGIIVEVRKEKKGPQTGKDIQLQIRSRISNNLDKTVARVLDKMKTIPSLTDVEDSRSLPAIEWVLEVDRAQAAKFGLDITTIGQSVRLLTNGLKISEYRTDMAEDEVDIILRLPKEERFLSQLDNLKIETENGSVPLSNFVKRVAKPKTGTIKRIDGFREITIKANVREGLNVEEQVQKIQNWLNSQKWADDIKFVFKGENEKMNNSMHFLIKAFIVALAIMTVILVLQFNSYYQAFLILSAVVMSTIGVLLGLIITAKPFIVVMGGIGVIALAGIIVNNNIVLIDTFVRLSKQNKMPAKEAILQSGRERLRPVLLTTVTTFLGLLPMVLQLNIDIVGREFSVGSPSTQWWVDLATAISFGLVFSTPLTLLVTPAALMLGENVKNYFLSKKLSEK